MNRIAAVFPLNGELNKYPFDRHGATLWLLMTIPTRQTQPQASHVPEAATKEELKAEHLAVGATALRQNVPVPITISLSASTPGIKIRGESLVRAV
jgi:hypothetical protein